MNIFLVEDDYLLNKSIKQFLTKKDFNVSSFHNGLDALNAINNDFAVMILDIDIPDVNGISILEEIRKIYPLKPVIMISATIDMDMIASAYQKGCNDYLKKPFDIRELEYKILALNRNHHHKIQITEALEYDPLTHQLFYKEIEIIFTTKEQKLLSILIENKGHTVMMEHLILGIWGYEGDSIHLRQLVARLRKKIPENIIENRMGSGYCIV